MLRAFVSLGRGLIPTLSRVWTPATRNKSRMFYFQNVCPTYSIKIRLEVNVKEVTRLPEPAINKERATSSFVDVLKEMMDSEVAPQTSENWSRPAPPPMNASEDLVFFQTEIREGMNAGQLSMFGVTKAGNSVCIHVAEYASSSFAKFTLDTEIPSMAWIKIPATKYTHMTDRDKLSHCQLECSAIWADVEMHVLEHVAPPLRILSFDVECLPREGIFPQPETDPVIQISNIVSISGNSAPPFVRNIFTLGTCSPIAGAAVLSYDEEAPLLHAWAEFVRTVDPDLVIGFNHTGFDLPYLLARAKALQVPAFPFLGRFKGVEAAQVRTVQYTTARGQVRTWKDIPLAGRLQLDLMHYVRCEMSATQLSLNAVAKRFLNEKKDDVHFTAIAGLQAESADTRRELAVYCLKDAYLPQRLLEVLGCVERYTTVAHKKRTQFNSIVLEHDVRATAMK